jgi:pSer/pThr/pTyr-binding forkhead associated (FHA) protein
MKPEGGPLHDLNTGVVAVAYSAVTEPMEALDISPVLPPGFRIRVTRGPSEGLVVESAERALSVGSAPGNDLVLDDLLVSGRQLVVEWSEGCYWVRYGESTSGGFLVDRGSPGLLLRDRSELMLGDTTLQFELLD